MENNALINIIIIKPNNFQFIKSDFYKNYHMLTENIMPYLEIKQILLNHAFIYLPTSHQSCFIV